MAFYETRETIAEQLGEYLKSVLLQKGLNTQDLVSQHKTITSQYSDSYSNALLMKGLKHEDAPTFSNVPYSSFVGIIRDNFEQVFEVLGLPTTQKAASEFQRTLRHRAMGRCQKDALLNASFVAKEFEKISNWCVRAKDILAAMNANVAILSSVTDEEREFARSLSFDWYYSYSDDAGVRRAGDARRNEVAKRVNIVLATKPYLMKVVEEIARVHRFKPSFFTQPD